MTAATTHYWTTADGLELSWKELGEGRPVILLHGLFSDAAMNWIKFGTAQTIADAGFRLIMPDHRAHGDSAASHDPAHYPAGVLAHDVVALIAHLGLDDYDLGGFSLGCRTVVQAVGALKLAPRKAMLMGMGLDGLDHWDKRQRFFLDAIAMKDSAPRGDPHWLAIQFMKSQKIDTQAAALVLGSFADAPRAWLDAFTMPTLVLIGADDDDNGSAQELADALPDATYAEVPGTHMTSITMPQLGVEIARFLVE